MLILGAELSLVYLLELHRRMVLQGLLLGRKLGLQSLVLGCQLGVSGLVLGSKMGVHRLFMDCPNDLHIMEPYFHLDLHERGQWRTTISNDRWNRFNE